MANLKKDFSKIYDKHIEKIYRFIFLKVNSEEVAQDLCSETFLKCWEAINGNNKIENAQAFLYAIARNSVIDYYRVKGRTQFVSLENTLLIDPRPKMEDAMILSSDLDLIKAALTNLKEDYQNVIIWRYLDDLSISEIATMIGKTEDTTRVTIHRALNSLRDKVNGKKVQEI